MANKIPHCGKNIPVENRYVVLHYPDRGDITYFDYARCEQCKHNVHAYQYQYLRKSTKTEVWISDKDNRHIFQEFIESGEASIVLGDIPTNTRAMVLACEWTLETAKHPEYVIYYLHKNEDSEWVSNFSILNLEKKRREWLKQLREKQSGRGL